MGSSFKNTDLKLFCRDIFTFIISRFSGRGPSVDIVHLIQAFVAVKSHLQLQNVSVFFPENIL